MVIQIDNLKKSYKVGTREVEVLKGVHLKVDQGDMIAIMGRSGAGKSTLLQIMAGLEQGDSGTYRFRQERVSEMNLQELAAFRRRHIGLILQNYALIDSKNVFNNIALPLRYSKQSKDEIEEKVTEILSSLEIEKLRDHAVDMLSGGERQRVAIARALIQNPELILADEPTGSLDEETEREILALFQDLNQQGKTLIIVTHNQQVADSCHQTYHMREGRCVPALDDRMAGTT